VLESSSNLLVDESLLTGESVAVRTTASGEARGRVHATGVRTQLGRIGVALNRVEVRRTAPQREVDRIVRLLDDPLHVNDAGNVAQGKAIPL